MKRTILLALSASIFLFWSCKNSEKKTESESNIPEMQAESHHHAESSEVIELNNGEKWIVNDEMKPFVLKGSTMVDEFIQENKTDYKELDEQLKEQNNQLIKSCTMDGKSHDELHKWLHPHLELVKELENETNAAKANEIVLQLQH